MIGGKALVLLKGTTNSVNSRHILPILFPCPYKIQHLYPAEEAVYFVLISSAIVDFAALKVKLSSLLGIPDFIAVSAGWQQFFQLIFACSFPT